jgi:hypothetical protein
MIKQFFSTIFLFSITISSAYAMPPFTGNDYSGEYTCKGNNASVGDYEVLVTLKLNTVTSHDIYGVYDFSTETNKQATYIGQIMAKGRKFAMTFKLLNASTSTFSTGMGNFKKMDNKRWAFNNTYYEPDGNGGNFGNDYCTMNAKKPNNQASKQTPQKKKNSSLQKK